MIVPSEKPAATRRITSSLFSVGVLSSFGTPPASLGGRMIRTVAEPVTLFSLSVPPRVPRDFDCELEPPLEPKIFVPEPFPSPVRFPDDLKNASSFQKI